MIRSLTHGTVRVVVVVLAILFGAACNSGKQSAETMQSTKTLKPSPSSTPPPAARIYDWYVGGGNSHLDAIAQDLEGVSTDADNEDWHSLESDCSALALDVEDAQQYASIPDGPSQIHWANALSDLDAGAIDCTTAAVSQDVATLNTAASEIRAANGELTIVSARIDQFS